MKQADRLAANESQIEATNEHLARLTAALELVVCLLEEAVGPLDECEFEPHLAN